MTDRWLTAVPQQLFIDGAWVDAAGGKTFDVVNPATGEVLCAVADASPEDGDVADGHFNVLGMNRKVDPRSGIRLWVG